MMMTTEVHNQFVDSTWFTITKHFTLQGPPANVKRFPEKSINFLMYGYIWNIFPGDWGEMSNDGFLRETLDCVHKIAACYNTVRCGQDCTLPPASMRLVTRTALFFVRTFSCCRLVPHLHFCWKCPSFLLSRRLPASRFLSPEFLRFTI